MSFTVVVTPRTATTPDPDVPDDPQMDTERTVYDIKVYDGQGQGHDGEQFLVGSAQGYENRSFAERLAMRLFGDAKAVALANGIGYEGDPVAEKALLVIQDHTGSAVDAIDLRP